MFTSHSKGRATCVRSARRYLCAGIVLLVFGAIYERMSFGVYSYFMLYAGAVPLVLGALPALVLASAATGEVPGALASRLWYAGVSTLAVGCVIQGALEIYGTWSGLTTLYWVAGAMLLATSLVCAGTRRAASSGRA